MVTAKSRQAPRIPRSQSVHRNAAPSCRLGLRSLPHRAHPRVPPRCARSNGFWTIQRRLTMFAVSLRSLDGSCREISDTNSQTSIGDIRAELQRSVPPFHECKLLHTASSWPRQPAIVAASATFCTVLRIPAYFSSLESFAASAENSTSPSGKDRYEMQITTVFAISNIPAEPNANRKK